MSGVQFATETYRTGFQKKDHGEDCESRRKSYLFSKVFVTNLQFGQVRFFFNVSDFFIFLLFPQNRQLGLGVRGRKCGSARLEGTPAMDLEVQGIRAHMYTDKRDIEQNIHP